MKIFSTLQQYFKEMQKWFCDSGTWKSNWIFQVTKLAMDLSSTVHAELATTTLLPFKKKPACEGQLLQYNPITSIFYSLGITLL